jgi:hypothetical protein
LAGAKAGQVTLSVAVASKGETLIKSTLQGHLVEVRIVTHEVDIGDPNRPPVGADQIVSGMDYPVHLRADGADGQCTFARMPCSPVDRLTITVDGKALWLQHSVYADLADVGTATLVQEGGHYLLRLDCGDAGGSFEMALRFDRKRVLTRRIIGGESQALMQETRYLPPYAGWR